MAFPRIPLIWSYGPCLVDLNHQFYKRSESPHCIHRRCSCLDKRNLVCDCGPYLMEVFTSLSCAGVMRITHSGYLFPSLGLIVARTLGGYQNKGMGCFLDTFVVFFVEFGVISKSRAFQLSTGRLLQLETTSEQHFFSCNIFVEIIFFHHHYYLFFFFLNQQLRHTSFIRTERGL